MKIETERWFVVIILIVIVILFVRLLFILTDKKRWDYQNFQGSRFQDTNNREQCNNEKYSIVKRDMKFVKMA